MVLRYGKDSTQRFAKIVMGAADRGGKRFFMDLNIHPRRHLMKRAMLNFVLPVLAVTTIATVIAFPSPAAFNAAIKQATTFTTVSYEPEVTDASSIIEPFASGVPGLAAQLEANRDCFVGLNNASPQKLRDCAPAVIAVIAEIVAYQDTPAVARALQNEGDGKLLPQLQVAAAEVCRSIWQGGTSLDAHLDSPVCQMAEVSLVQYPELR